MKSVKHLANIKKHDNYETPPKLFYKKCEELDFFPKLDVCANSSNNKCPRFITEKEDSLLFEWNEDFFMNPPYSKVEKFIKKAYYQCQKHKVRGLILIFAKTDTKWWHSYIEKKCEVQFVKGRIKFFKNGHETKNSAPYPSCWILMNF